MTEKYQKGARKKKGERQTPPRVTPRLKGKVKNAGIKEKKK